MEQEPDIDVVRARLRQAFDDFATDRVQVVSRKLAGATHLVASRQGLYAINDQEWTLLLPGFFFGLTLRGPEIFAFEACDLPQSPLRRGRIVRFRREGNEITEATVVYKGLDSGCHQIDFCAGQLHVLDTYNQQVVRFGFGESAPETLSPLPVPPHGRWTNTDRRYGHANSLLRVGETFLVLLHNSSEHTGRNSEIVLFDLHWQRVDTWRLAGRSCHGLALLPDGTLLVCDSMAGDLITAQGKRVHISPFLTRGLALGEDTIAVGSSQLARRSERLNSSGTITFLDSSFRQRAVLQLPAAPTEVRRLDGQDGGLSSYLERVSWGQSLLPGSSVASTAT